LAGRLYISYYLRSSVQQ